MLFKTITLKDFFPKLETSATLTIYARDNSPEIAPNRKRPAVIVCPGGGYAFRSDREAEPVALEFLTRGYQAFILNYSVAPVKYPAALLEAAAAFAYIRSNADALHVNPDAISVCGFSAGGHLTASIGTLWNDPMLSEVLGVPNEQFKPNALVLSYPVISSGEFAHVGSFDNLAGDDAQLRKYLSLEDRVGEHTPPSFIWHTFTDGTVPVENSLMFANAMRKHNIPFELHIFPDGYHGLSLGTDETLSCAADRVNEHISVWMNLCDRWLKTMFSLCD